MFFLVGVVKLQKEVELVDVAPALPGALQLPGKVESVKKKTLPASYRAEKALSFSIS